MNNIITFIYVGKYFHHLSDDCLSSTWTERVWWNRHTEIGSRILKFKFSCLLTSWMSLKYWLISMNPFFFLVLYNGNNKTQFAGLGRFEIMHIMWPAQSFQAVRLLAWGTSAHWGHWPLGLYLNTVVPMYNTNMIKNWTIWYYWLLGYIIIRNEIIILV